MARLKASKFTDALEVFIVQQVEDGGAVMCILVILANTLVAGAQA